MPLKIIINDVNRILIMAQFTQMDILIRHKGNFNFSSATIITKRNKGVGAHEN